MLKYRLLTAIILLPLFIWALYRLPIFLFAWLILAVVLLSAWEWTSLIPFERILLKIIYVLLFFIGVLGMPYIPVVFSTSLMACVWIWLGFAVWRFNKNAQPLGLQYASVRSVLGILVLLSTWQATVAIQIQPEFGPNWLLAAFLIIWAADTGAYFSGRLWGKRKLAEQVSPKKTWAGYFGGIVLAVFVSFIASLYLLDDWQYRAYFCLIGFFTAQFSVVGDLTISVLKRQSGLKDSGQLLPGHGGILDRVDSLAPGLVIYLFGLILFSFVYV